MSFLLPTYNRFGVRFVSGKGPFLYAEKGKEYLDFLSGIGVNVLGYGYPPLVEKLKILAEKPWHISNFFHIESQEHLAEEIVKALFPAKVFFSNSGAEANEAAIKIARLYGKKRKNGAYKILVAENSFHGRTLATISATGQEKVQKNFEPLCPGFEFFKFNDLSSLFGKLNDDVVAVMLEPIQGEGGVIPAKVEFLYDLRQETRKRGILLILDEVQTGVGRTGDLYAFQGYGVQPDIFTSAKALGGGLPIGATVVHENISDVVTPGVHGSTFGGNPLVTGVAIEVIRRVKEPDFLSEVRDKGNYLQKRLEYLKEQFSFIKVIRGRGLMWGIDLDMECKEVVEKALKKGLIINCTAGSVVRMLPPLIIDESHIDRAIEILEEVFRESEEE